MADKRAQWPATDGTLVNILLHDNGDGTYSLPFSTPAGGFPTNDASAVLYAGTASLTTTAAAIASTQAIREVLLQNDPDNLVDIFIGNASAQSIQLKPGDSFVIAVSDLAAVYAKSASGTPTLNYLGRS